MPEQFQNNDIDSNQSEKIREDLTGRDGLFSNVTFNWIGHFVFIIAGFILPRMIDQRLGQELLGIWDFTWSLVSYFPLVGAGVASSVNRYVARYRIAGDISALNRIVSSVLFITTISGMLVLGLTIAASLLLPQWFGARLGENVHEAQWVVLFLGISIGIEIAFGAFNGVLTGFHKWGLLNIIASGWYAATITGMIIALLMGKGLWILALINLMGTVLAFATRMIFAYRVCEGLRVHPSLVSWDTIRKVFTFGVKTLIPSLSQLLLNQTVSVLIVVYLGPAMLALYARPRSIIRHLNMLVNRMAFVLVPTISSLQSEGDLEGIRELLMKSVRYSFYMVLPIVLMLVVFGGPILHLWMGPRYDNGWVLAILAMGFFVALVQGPMRSILIGLNAHGRAGIAEFVASLCSVGLIVLVLGFLRWGLVGISVAVTVPLTIMNVIYLPLLLRRRIGLDVKQYFLSVAVRPMIHVFLFAICLMGARLVFATRPLMGLVTGGAVGSTVLVAVYWRYVLPDRIKMWICRCLHNLLRSAGLGFQPD